MECPAAQDAPPLLLLLLTTRKAHALLIENSRVRLRRCPHGLPFLTGRDCDPPLSQSHVTAAPYNSTRPTVWATFKPSRPTTVLY